MTWLSDDQPVVPRHPQRRVLTSTGIPPNSCKLCQSFSWDPCPEVTSFFRLVELAHYLQGQRRCHNSLSFSEHSSGFDTPTPSSTILLLMRPSPARHKAHHPTRWQNAAIALAESRILGIIFRSRSCEHNILAQQATPQHQRHFSHLEAGLEIHLSYNQAQQLQSELRCLWVQYCSLHRLL
jgi:hypothetical protein